MANKDGVIVLCCVPSAVRGSQGVPQVPEPKVKAPVCDVDADVPDVPRLEPDGEEAVAGGPSFRDPSHPEDEADAKEPKHGHDVLPELGIV